MAEAREIIEMKNIYCAIFALALLCVAPARAVFVVDHSNLYLFDQIPEQYIIAAQNINMEWGDRSVGGNIDEGLDCLAYETDELAPSSCKRDGTDPYTSPASELNWYRPGGYNRSNWDFYFIPGLGVPQEEDCPSSSTFFGPEWSKIMDCFIEHANRHINEYEVFSHQHSYLNVVDGESIASPTAGYFVDTAETNIYNYEALETQYPSKTFMYWTSSLARGIGTQVSTDYNNQMRQFAQSRDKILLDVADIESYDLYGNPCYDNRDGVPYGSENYPDDGLNLPAICPYYTSEANGGHLGSPSAGKIKIAKGFWIIMAYIAGWRPSGAPDTTPPAISSVQSSSVTQNSATITWTTDEAAGSEINYGLTASYGANANNTALVTSHSQQLTGLTANTLYHYRVKSRDAAGNMATSGDFTFTTSGTDTQAPSQVTGMTATAVSSSQINLLWNAATDNVGVAGYRVYRGGVNIANSTGTSYSSAGLSANTTYTHSVAAYDAAGNIGVQSSGASATTLPASTQFTITTDSTYPGYSTSAADDGVINAAGGAAATWLSANTSVDHWVEITSASQVQFSNATVWWAHDGVNYTNSRLLAIQYWTGTTYQNAIVQSLSPNTNRTSLSFPVANTTRLRFLQPAGFGPLSNPNSMWVTEVDYGMPPGDVTPPTISNVQANSSPTSATIAWNTNEPATSVVDYGPTASYGITATNSTPTASPSVRLAGLSSNTQYFYRITSIDQAGNPATTTGSFITMSSYSGIILRGQVMRSAGVPCPGCIFNFTMNGANGLATTASDGTFMTMLTQTLAPDIYSADIIITDGSTVRDFKRRITIA